MSAYAYLRAQFVTKLLISALFTGRALTLRKDRGSKNSREGKTEDQKIRACLLGPDGEERQQG
jgi:hypothetical protein